MCFPSCKSLLICASFAALFVLILVTTGPSVFTVPASKIKEYLPTPHVTVTFAGAYGLSDSPAYDISKAFTRAGYDIEVGKLAPLSFGTCEQCMGSPSDGNPHLAVLLKDFENTSPACLYNDTELSTTFHLASDEALVILTEGPTPDTYREFSWGVYLFDKWGTKGRNLIQAGIGRPLRLKRSSKMLLIFSFMPEIMDVLSEGLQVPDVDPSDVHLFELSTKIIQTSLAPIYNDRLAVLLKTLPKDTKKARDHAKYLTENTEILRVRLGNPETRALVRKGITYDSYHNPILGMIRGDERTEFQTLSDVVERVVLTVKNIGGVIDASKMIPLREVIGIKGPEDCAEKATNCLAEDWDLAYSVSGGLTLPHGFVLAIVGIDHPEGSRTTLSLFDVTRNQELVLLPVLNSPPLPDDDIVYVLWLSRDCSRELRPCVEVHVEGEFFIRERSYGMESYENLVSPRVLLIKR